MVGRREGVSEEGRGVLAKKEGEGGGQRHEQEGDRGLRKRAAGGGNPHQQRRKLVSHDLGWW